MTHQTFGISQLTFGLHGISGSAEAYAHSIGRLIYLRFFALASLLCYNRALPNTQRKTNEHTLSKNRRYLFSNINVYLCLFVVLLSSRSFHSHGAYSAIYIFV